MRPANRGRQCPGSAQLLRLKASLAVNGRGQSGRPTERNRVVAFGESRGRKVHRPVRATASDSYDLPKNVYVLFRSSLASTRHEGSRGLPGINAYPILNRSDQISRLRRNVASVASRGVILDSHGRTRTGLGNGRFVGRSFEDSSVGGSLSRLKIQGNSRNGKSIAAADSPSHIPA